MNLTEWIDSVSGPGWFWYAKILAANDTLATGAHQAGPYLPKDFVFRAFPSLERNRTANPRVSFGVGIASHGIDTEATAIWYNQRTRNETRMTGWGGRGSPLLDPDNTGALCIFAFHKPSQADADYCAIWLSSGADEDGLIESRTGVVDPGVGILLEPSTGRSDLHLPKRLAPCDAPITALPYDWQRTFPDATSLVRKAVELCQCNHLQSDERLLRRRECEYRLFKTLEESVVLPRIREGFPSVDEFVNYANAVANRRKARSGASLELQTGVIFDEAGISYSRGSVSEGHKRPDFLFPNAEAYHDKGFPAEQLRMLAAKTTCKDRWRQILNEADRIPVKHLLTLQEGVSEHQFAEMTASDVRLVVPALLQRHYPRSVRSRLVNLEGFIGEVRETASP